MAGLLAALLLAWAGVARAQEADMTTAYDFTFTSIEGQPLPFDTYKGKAVLVVNTASECGFTPQYKDLQALYERYRARGLVVLGVPSNDFGGQEPGQEAQIKSFCEVTYGVDFPLTAKEHVKGDEAHPFYKWAGEKAGMIGRPKWNFHKYLIGPDGQFVDWFSSVTSPSAERVAKAVEKVLPQ